MTGLLTRSETVQVLVLFATVLLPSAFLRRRVDGPDRHGETAAGLLPPWRLFLLSLLLVAPLAVAIYFLSDLIELGLFWFVAFFWPWVEIYESLLQRDIERRGVGRWKPERPLRDAATTGLITAPIIAGIALLFDSSMPFSEAILAGVACGLIVALLGLLSDRLDRRSSTGN